METGEVLVMAVRYELVFSTAEEAVDIGRASSLEIDCVEMREVGHDAVNAPAFPALFVERINRERAVECILPRGLGREEEVKLADDGDMRIDDDVVVGLRIGV